jgi:hypothetical protein
MSISIEEFIRMIAKDDPTIKRLREQFAIKTKLKSEKMHSTEEEDDSEEELIGGNESIAERVSLMKTGKVSHEVSSRENGSENNPIREFRQK